MRKSINISKFKVIFLAFCLPCYLVGNCHTANAVQFTIDFESLAAGTAVTNQFVAQGVTFDLLGTPVNYADGPVVVNLSNVYQPGGSGKGIASGDDGVDPFFDILLTFIPSIDYLTFFSLDSDEPLTVNAYFQGNQVFTTSLGIGSNNQVNQITIGQIGGALVFDSVLIDVVAGPGGNGIAGGPEYFDNFTYNTVPEPSTLTLLGVFSLAGWRRFRKARVE